MFLLRSYLQFKITMLSSQFLFVIIFLLNIYQYSDGQSSSHFFRNDYTFLEGPQSFYKIHTLQRNWQDAKKRCKLEGASLMYPEDRAEVEAIMEHWNKTQPQYWWVWIGVSDLLVKGNFDTIDGRPILDVYNGWGAGEPNDAGGAEDCVILRNDKTLADDHCGKTFPFICKKELLSLEWNVFCDLPDLSYLYDKDNGKCYKFHLTPMTWPDAYSVCSAEQSYLAIINSDKEAEHLVQLTANSGKEKIGGNFLSGAVHLGFHNRDGDGWKTIKPYLYDKDNGKCYKFHLTPMTWPDAYSVCSAEQSYLAIINSDKEAEHLVQLTANSGKEKIGGNFLSGAVHLGFHNRDGDGWKTIKHVPLEESGYVGWGYNQPDGGDNETCGTMFYNGKLNDLSCTHKCFFICEHDITLLNVAIDEKFG